VGPLALFHRSALFHVSSSAPFRSTMFSNAVFSNAVFSNAVFPNTMPRSTVFPRTTLRSRKRINTLPIENAMRRPTSL